MALGSEIPDQLTVTDEGDEILGISKSGSKVETVGMLFSLGGTSRCDGVREFDAVGVDEDSSKHSWSGVVRGSGAGSLRGTSHRSGGGGDGALEIGTWTWSCCWYLELLQEFCGMRR